MSPSSGAVWGHAYVWPIVALPGQRLRAYRVGRSLGRPGSQPGWQGWGGGIGSKAAGSGTDCPGPSKCRVEALWLSCCRGTWLRKPLSPHNRPVGTCEGSGPRLVGLALTLTSPLTLALITILTLITDTPLRSLPPRLTGQASGRLLLRAGYQGGAPQVMMGGAPCGPGRSVGWEGRHP